MVDHTSAITCHYHTHSWLNTTVSCCMVMCTDCAQFFQWQTRRWRLCMLYAVSTWRMDLLRRRGSRPVLLQHYNRKTRENTDGNYWLLNVTSHSTCTLRNTKAFYAYANQRWCTAGASILGEKWQLEILYYVTQQPVGHDQRAYSTDMQCYKLSEHLKQEYRTYLFTMQYTHLLEIQKLQLTVRNMVHKGIFMFRML